MTGPALPMVLGRLPRSRLQTSPDIPSYAHPHTPSYVAGASRPPPSIRDGAFPEPPQTQGAGGCQDVQQFAEDVHLGGHQAHITCRFSLSRARAIDAGPNTQTLARLSNLLRPRQLAQVGRATAASNTLCAVRVYRRSHSPRRPLSPLGTVPPQGNPCRSLTGPLTVVPSDTVDGGVGSSCCRSHLFGYSLAVEIEP
ncbi:hypothetical protein C8Q77DRAFT_358217 [Trametes polyzona]|nr:hypothetical protein C8Q77DRAFT_358217 [Trametes polyzona]